MKKYIAPIIITILGLIFIIVYAYVILSSFVYTGFPKWLIILIFILFLFLLCALIFTFYKRIKEIKEENEDDISKY